MYTPYRLMQSQCVQLVLSQHFAAMHLAVLCYSYTNTSQYIVYRFQVMMTQLLLVVKMRTMSALVLSTKVSTTWCYNLMMLLGIWEKVWNQVLAIPSNHWRRKRGLFSGSIPFCCHVTEIANQISGQKKELNLKRGRDFPVLCWKRITVAHGRRSGVSLRDVCLDTTSMSLICQCSDC